MVQFGAIVRNCLVLDLTTVLFLSNKKKKSKHGKSFSFSMSHQTTFTLNSCTETENFEIKK